MEYKYKYQMHTHTTPTSKCGVMTSRELCAALKEGGYAGAVLTNHFLHGNSGISRELPWEEFVGAYEKDYLDALDAAKEFDVDILFGIEEHVGGGIEILLYGVMPKWLYDHPELREGGIDAYKRAAEGTDILIIQAHPYRVRGYITRPGPLPLQYLDGIEVYNRANQPHENPLAEELANENPRLILTSGADAHNTHTVTFAGIATKERITDEKKLVDILRSGDYELIKN